MFGDIHARVHARAQLREPVDVLIVATKASGLDAALGRIEAEPRRLVLPLLNGLDHIAVLRGRFGRRRCSRARSASSPIVPSRASSSIRANFC